MNLAAFKLANKKEPQKVVNLRGFKGQSEQEQDSILGKSGLVKKKKSGLVIARLPSLWQEVLELGQVTCCTGKHCSVGLGFPFLGELSIET